MEACARWGKSMIVLDRPSSAGCGSRNARCGLSLLVGLPSPDAARMTTGRWRGSQRRAQHQLRPGRGGDGGVAPGVLVRRHRSSLGAPRPTCPPSIPPLSTRTVLSRGPSCRRGGDNAAVQLISAPYIDSRDYADTLSGLGLGGGPLPSRVLRAHLPEMGGRNVRRRPDPCPDRRSSSPTSRHRRDRIGPVALSGPVRLAAALTSTSTRSRRSDPVREADPGNDARAPRSERSAAAGRGDKRFLRRREPIFCINPGYGCATITVP